MARPDQNTGGQQDNPFVSRWNAEHAKTVESQRRTERQAALHKATEPIVVASGLRYEQEILDPRRAAFKATLDLIGTRAPIKVNTDPSGYPKLDYSIEGTTTLTDHPREVKIEISVSGIGEDAPSSYTEDLERDTAFDYAIYRNQVELARLPKDATSLLGVPIVTDADHKKGVDHDALLAAIGDHAFQQQGTGLYVRVRSREIGESEWPRHKTRFWIEDSQINHGDKDEVSPWGAQPLIEAVKISQDVEEPTIEDIESYVQEQHERLLRSEQTATPPAEDTTNLTDQQSMAMLRAVNELLADITDQGDSTTDN